MRLSRRFIAAMAVLIVAVFAIQMHLPARFNWDITFSPNDPYPFGSRLFDSVLAVSMPHGYHARHTTLWQLAGQKATVNILITRQYLNYDSADYATIHALLDRGSKIIIASGSIPYDSTHVAKWLGMDVEGMSYFNLETVKDGIRNGDDMRDTLYWAAADGFKSHEYHTLEQIAGYSSMGLDDDKHWQVLAYKLSEDEGEKPERRPIAARRRVGKGELIVVASPLLFTNYAMLEDDTYQLVFRLMTYIADKPVVRLTNEEASAEAEELASSPFRAILRSRQLTWALYATLAVILIFFVFTARRRQRPIPVIAPPQNHTLEFARLIGTLFYQKHDRSGLIRRKWELFATQIRQQVGVDVEALDDDDALFSQLAARTGMTYEQVAHDIKQLRFLVANERNATRTETKEAVRMMNDMLGRAEGNV